LERSAVDPGSGGAFYTLSQKETSEPRLEKQGMTCLLCHNSSSTGGVPGFLVRSIYPDRHGSAIDSVGKDIVTDQTPIKDRWGGWYMTGKHSEPASVGNWKSPLLANEVGNVRVYLSRLKLDDEDPQPDLATRFNTKAYLTPHSDIVALMVLTHQANLHNLIAVANQKARKAGYDGSDMAPVVEPLVRAMLFVREAPLTGPMSGDTGFTAEFASAGPRDRQGRSLRDFDLKTRLFKYPLSYLIYSDGFSALPAAAKISIYRRLREILSGEDQSQTFAHLSGEDRDAILSILKETKPDFATFLTTHQ
jgi:hypothetical protein